MLSFSFVVFESCEIKLLFQLVKCCIVLLLAKLHIIKLFQFVYGFAFVGEHWGIVIIIEQGETGTPFW